MFGLSGPQQENEEFNRQELEARQCGRRETQVEEAVTRKIILDVRMPEGPCDQCGLWY